VRHPRYTAILFSGIAFALVFASFLAWALFFVWLVLILRRIRREERHLREIFGADYDAYAAHTARLLPGVF
jgi:protein-S-isoprenylcysteine O-methyltransferase Ste14